MCNLYPVETTFSASKTPLDGGESSIYSVMMCESDQTVSWMSSWKQYCDAHTTLQEKVYIFFFFLNHSDTMPPGGTVGESLSNKCSRWAPSHPTLRWTALCELESNKICLCCLIQLPSKKKKTGWIFISLAVRGPLMPYSESKSACVIFINIESQFWFNWPASVLAVSVAVVFVWSVAAIWHETQEKPIQSTYKRTEEHSVLSAWRGEHSVFIINSVINAWFGNRNGHRLKFKKNNITA